MEHSPQVQVRGAATVSDALAGRPAIESVAGFVPGPGTVRLALKFGVARLREALVPEIDHSEFNPKFSGTFFEHVHAELSKRFPISCMRVLAKGLCTCNSWRRGPAPRLHMPMVTNPGSHFVVSHHVPRPPADGLVQCTDTRAIHSALNGGETRRARIVAALANRQVTS